MSLVAPLHVHPCTAREAICTFLTSVGGFGEAWRSAAAGFDAACGCMAIDARDRHANVWARAEPPRQPSIVIYRHPQHERDSSLAAGGRCMTATLLLAGGWRSMHDRKHCCSLALYLSGAAWSKPALCAAQAAPGDTDAFRTFLLSKPRKLRFVSAVEAEFNYVFSDLELLETMTSIDD